MTLQILKLAFNSPVTLHSLCSVLWQIAWFNKGLQCRITCFQCTMVVVVVTLCILFLSVDFFYIFF